MDKKEIKSGIMLRAACLDVRELRDLIRPGSRDWIPWCTASNSTRPISHTTRHLLLCWDWGSCDTSAAPPRPVPEEGVRAPPDPPPQQDPMPAPHYLTK